MRLTKDEVDITCITISCFVQKSVHGEGQIMCLKPLDSKLCLILSYPYNNRSQGQSTRHILGRSHGSLFFAINSLHLVYTQRFTYFWFFGEWGHTIVCLCMCYHACIVFTITNMGVFLHRCNVCTLHRGFNVFK